MLPLIELILLWLAVVRGGGFGQRYEEGERKRKVKVEKEEQHYAAA